MHREPFFENIRIHFRYADNSPELCRYINKLFNYQKVIIFAMRRKTKERRDAEKELLYYLEIYTELRGREGVGQVLEFYDELIREVLEKIKLMK